MEGTHVIDLRSDTVTRPTKEMRQAIMEAELGDDVYGEDPTVNRLEEMVATMLGKEAALLIPSGTQGNQIAILNYCKPGSEVIMEKESHNFYNEAGAAAAFAGVQLRTLEGERGALSAEQVEEAIRGENIHFPSTALILVENTHNRAGGAIIPLEKMQAVYRVAQAHSIPVFLDGTRLLNASVATGIPVHEFAACSDALMIGLSKGLGAPIGSVMAGSREWIEKAKKWRKRLGGGMRQAGIIAAPGIVALETMIDRLAEDHANARFLAEGLANIPGFQLNPELVETNIVVAKLTKPKAAEVSQQLKERGIIAIPFDGSSDTIRFTTHKDVTRADLEKTLSALNDIFKTNF